MKRPSRQRSRAWREAEVRVFVGALLLCQDDRILLAKRSASRAYYPCVWDVPGGHCEEGESLEQTLVRELHEEMGVTPSGWQKLAEMLGTDDSGESYELHLYAVTAWDGVPCNLQPHEHSQIGWFTVDEACRLPLAHPDYPRIFRLAGGT